MGDRYLTDLADVCRAAGLDVEEVDGWESRARGSGGYGNGLPNHVMIHHTASPPSSDGWPDVEYCTFGDDDAPLCNLYLDRQGVVYVCAAGATNTNGTGTDPCHVTADDSMNASAIGIEAGNNGVGERWPDDQADAYLALCGALCDAYAIPPARVHAHWEWAPGRKTDPAGPDRWSQPPAVAAGPSPLSWNMAEFRGDLDHVPPPPDSPEEDSVLSVFAKCAGQDGTFAVYTGGYKIWCQTVEIRDAMRDLAAIGGHDPNIYTYDEVMFRAFGPIVGPIQDGYDPWGVRT